MIIVVRRWVERIKFIALFVALTGLFYYLLMWISPWMEPSDKYKEPAGNAVKAFNEELLLSGESTFSERLRFFFWFGGA